MRLLLLLVLMFVALSSLVVAVEVTFSNEQLQPGGVLSISVAGCSGMWLLEIVSSLNETVALEQGDGIGTANYNTFSDSLGGLYTTRVFCDDGGRVDRLFCVGEESCNEQDEGVVISRVVSFNYSLNYYEDLVGNYSENYSEFKTGYLRAVEDNNRSEREEFGDLLRTLKDDLRDAQEGIEQLEESQAGNESFEDEYGETIESLDDEIDVLIGKISNLLRYGREEVPAARAGVISGSGSCNPRWNCSVWQGCTLGKEIRTCVDMNHCQASYSENRSCGVCVEAWTCMGWSSCAGGKQSRRCSDENFCGSWEFRPETQRDCVVSNSTNDTLEQFGIKEGEKSAKQASPGSIRSSTGDEQVDSLLQADANTMVWLIVACAVLLIVIVVVVSLMMKHRREARSPIQDYVASKRVAGSSDEQIRQTLRGSGWNEEDIGKALKK